MCLFSVLYIRYQSCFLPAAQSQRQSGRPRGPHVSAARAGGGRRRTQRVAVVRGPRRRAADGTARAKRMPRDGPRHQHTDQAPGHTAVQRHLNASR